MLFETKLNIRGVHYGKHAIYMVNLTYIPNLDCLQSTQRRKDQVKKLRKNSGYSFKQTSCNFYKIDDTVLRREKLSIPIAINNNLIIII